MVIIQERLAQVAGMPIKSGQHYSLEQGGCMVELVSYVAGETWSDHPKCACPVISAFLRSWNDSLPSDADRDRLLKPLIPQLVDSKSTKGVEERRSYLALDWLVRVLTPKFLDLVPILTPHAKALRDLKEIADLAGAVAAGKITAAAESAAGSAAGSAAWDAAKAAAWAAAKAAAKAAAEAAAWAAAEAAAEAAAKAAAKAAAWAAAWDAAKAAAWAAAKAAAKAAAEAALKPTVEWLQVSALDLIDRMLTVQPTVAMGAVL